MDDIDFEIDDFSYLGSTIGNAYFSGVTYEQLWDCVTQSSNREELDIAVGVTILLNEVTDAHSRRNDGTK